MSFHLSTSFGVVPEPIKAWKPEMAPQAMVMEIKGQTGLPSTWASTVDKLGHGGELDLRVDADHADHQRAEHADLHKAGDVAARGEQQPDRQRGGEEGVDGQRQTDGLGTQGQPGTEGALLHVGAEEDAGQHGGKPDPGGGLQVAGQLVPDPHHHGDGDGHEDREHAQALRSSACTTTMERPAMVMVMMNSIARPVHQPAMGPSSAFATSERDLP